MQELRVGADRAHSQGRALEQRNLSEAESPEACRNPAGLHIQGSTRQVWRGPESLPFRLPQVSGCCWLTPRRTLETSGGLLSSFPTVGEEMTPILSEPQRKGWFLGYKGVKHKKPPANICEVQRRGGRM